MRLNTQRKVFLAVLGVAGLALAADRLFLDAGGPQHASAANGVVPAPQAQEKPATGPVIQAASHGKSSRLAQLFEHLAQTESLHGDAVTDAFAIPASWMPLLAEPQAAPAEAQASDEKPPETEADNPNLVLTAVMAGSARPAAIINGRLIVVGNTVEGLTLESVAHGSAVVVSADGRRHELTVKTPGAPRQNR